MSRNLKIVREDANIVSPPTPPEFEAAPTRKWPCLRATSSIRRAQL